MRKNRKTYIMCAFFVCFDAMSKEKESILYMLKKNKELNKKGTNTHSMEHMDNMTCRRAVRLKPNHVFHCDKITMIEP